MVRLKASGLTLGHDGPFVHEVDLGLEEGKLVALIGPNGAGKSTLLRGLGGLLRPMSGTLLLEGRPLRSLGTRERARQIAVLPQSPRTPADVSVERFVAGGRYAHRGALGGDPDGPRVISDAMREADLFPLKDRLLHELSGGQLQKALFARARTQDPKLLLVDEPTTALDPQSQLWVLDRVAEMVAEGRSALVVTHELNLASQYADEILLLQDGRIRARGTPGETLTRERLEAVYGPDLLVGRAPAAKGEERPFVIPWRGGGRPIAE